MRRAPARPVLDEGLEPDGGVEVPRIVESDPAFIHRTGHPRGVLFDPCIDERHIPLRTEATRSKTGDAPRATLWVLFASY